MAVKCQAVLEGFFILVRDNSTRHSVSSACVHVYLLLRMWDFLGHLLLYIEHLFNVDKHVGMFHHQGGPCNQDGVIKIHQDGELLRRNWIHFGF